MNAKGCIVCGKTFTPPYLAQKTCCKECKRKHGNDRQRKRRLRGDVRDAAKAYREKPESRVRQREYQRKHRKKPEAKKKNRERYRHLYESQEFREQENERSRKQWRDASRRRAYLKLQRDVARLTHAMKTIIEETKTDE
jgi:hypothetical protein